MTLSDNADLHQDLQSCAKTDGETEFWLARDLQERLGYKRWEAFEKVVLKAAENCALVGIHEGDHFRQVTKMVQIGSGADRHVTDYALSRYGAYLVAVNADGTKPNVAFIKHYFVTKARSYEIIEQRIADAERLESRNQLKAIEKALSEVLFEHGLDGRQVGAVRSKGDTALFGGLSTQAMKDRYGISASRPLADFLPTLTIAAKSLVNEMTRNNVSEQGLHGERIISIEHVQNSQGVREMLGKRGIKPEELAAAEDLQKIGRRVSTDEKKLASQTLPVIEQG